ncbi:hypothetical protein C8A00DRAFT_34222 [Chaetomidium leptoderma]|uniref:Uncharacterized protein n=1 Tax=Chaetomidium leptoderma TaxID=669021 RepID=A0AAN6ZWT4_9PEZI|nr:hypothetical protein C8A00DRAFT_34222 [Chaetomidium leptoderma]
MCVRVAAAILLDFAQRQVDRVVSPESRQNTYSQTKQFAAARPLLFSLIVVQAIFSTMPVLFFISFVFSVIFVVSSISLLFTLFWASVALFVVVPVLVLTSSMALFSWAFGVATFGAGRSLFDFLQIMNPSVRPEVRFRPRTEFIDRHRLAPRAQSSSSSSTAPWTKVEGQKQAEGPGSKGKAPAHPDHPASNPDTAGP